MNRRHGGRIAALVATLLASANALAVEPWQEYHKRIEAAQTITALGDDLMGDSVSPYNGATEFTATDIDIPGNNALPVRLSRRFKVELFPSGPSPAPNANLKGIGNWDIEVPYITMSTVSDVGWSAQRCSVGGAPDAPGFQSTEVWQGDSVHIPGEGDRTLLAIEAQTPKPTRQDVAYH